MREKLEKTVLLVFKFLGLKLLEWSFLLISFLVNFFLYPLTLLVSPPYSFSFIVSAQTIKSVAFWLPVVAVPAAAFLLPLYLSRSTSNCRRIFDWWLFSTLVDFFIVFFLILTEECNDGLFIGICAMAAFFIVFLAALVAGVRLTGCGIACLLIKKRQKAEKKRKRRKKRRPLAWRY